MALYKPNIFFIRKFMGMEKTQESNQIRVQARLGGSLRLKIIQDLNKGYKQAELVKMAFDALYSEKNRY